MKQYKIGFKATLLLLLSANGSSLFLLDNALDDTNSDSLFHVSDGESTKWWVLGESLNGHSLGWDQLNNGGITRFDELGVVLNGFTGSSVNLSFDHVEFASGVASVAIKHG